MKACDEAIRFDLCNKRIHIRCNNRSNLDYKDLKIRDECWYCKTCIQEILPVYRKTVN